MSRDNKNIFIFIFIAIIIFVISYFLFQSGTSEKINAGLSRLKASAIGDYGNSSDRPIIKMVINSSGEKVVSTDVAITAFIKTTKELLKVRYSFDKKNWYDAKYSLKNDMATAKILFSKNMDEKVYIQAINMYGYKSYIYETSVTIEK